MAAKEKERLETADGYIRVSKVAGRDGESFISPDVQRKKIQAWADLHNVEIAAWWEELDQSGKERDRPRSRTRPRPVATWSSRWIDIGGGAWQHCVD